MTIAVRLETVAVVLLAVLGLTVGGGSIAVAGGLHRGRPVALWSAAFHAALPWGPLLALGVVLAAAVGIGAATRGSGHGARSERIPATLIPLMLGLSLPLVAPVLDAFWVHGTAPPLAAAGAGFGLLAALHRAGGASTYGAPSEGEAALMPAADDDPGSASCHHGARPVLAALAVLLPLLMTAPGEPWWHGLSGDEPHYVVIALSLVTDGDVDVGNQYRRQAYRRWYPAELTPHTKPGAAPASRYSIHGLGLGVWLAPWVALTSSLDGARAVLLLRFAMLLWLGVLAWVMHALLTDLAGPGPASWGTAIAVFTTPLLFAGPHVFTEVPAAALSASAYLLLRRRPSVVRALAAGGLLALLPWLHFKYAGMAAALATVGMVFARRGASGVRPRRDWRIAAALLAPLTLTVVAHGVYTWTLYRRLSPLAIFIGSGEAGRLPAFGEEIGAYVTDLPGAVRAGVSYLMDQKDGLLFHAPHYLLAAAGAGWMWRRRRADLVALGVVLAGLWGPYALSQEVGFWSPPVRPLTGALWTLAVPLGIALGRPRLRRRLARLAGGLLAAGVGMALLHLVQADLLYHDAGVVRSLLLQRYGAPGLPLWRAFPVWVEYGQQAQWSVSAAWLVVVVATAAWLGRRGYRLAGRGDPDGGRSRPVRVVFARAAALVWGFGTLAILLHHALVPISALHRPYPLGGDGRLDHGLMVWEPVSPHQRAWPEEESPEGVWLGGDDVAELWISSSRPLQELALSVWALGPVSYRLQVGSDLEAGATPGGVRQEAVLNPGPGWRWNESWVYRLRVACDGGVSPVELGLGDDGRNLGIRLGVRRVRRAAASWRRR